MISARGAGRWRAALAAGAVLMLAAACHTPAARADASETVVRLPTTQLTLVTSNGRKHVYTVEVARSGAEQQRGLMYRRAMPRTAGMIFPMKRPYASFWMANTYIPLDIIFIDPAGEVLNIGRGVPESRDTVDSNGPVSAVLELNAGEAERIGLKPGDKVIWKG